MTDVTTPTGFWRRYKEEIIKAKPSPDTYRDSKSWTKLTRKAAEDTIESEHLEPIREPLTSSTEYLRVDVIGEEKHEGKWNWSLRIAFEHENVDGNDQWKQELCKLTHVVANLRVLAGYYNSTSEALELTLQDQINLLQRESCRITRVPDCAWLFIFGPAGRAKTRGGEFLIYTLERTTVVRLADENPLIPRNWEHWVA